MIRYIPLLILALVACSNETVELRPDTATYTIDASRITVSGVSSGGYMAGQMHLAHSALFNGVAIVSGGPYYCAMGKMSQALGPCIKGAGLDLEPLINYARLQAGEGTIDDLTNLANDRVWVFHGALDSIVAKDASEAAAKLYAGLITEDAVTLVTDIAAVHGLPTLSSGPPCDQFAAPYLNACDYDAAGEILNTLYNNLKKPSTDGGKLLSIAQPGFDDAHMLEQAYLYVPSSCATGATCGVHVAVHGCSQSSEFIADAFALGAGFNTWADANQLLVLYPQVASSKIAPMNPYGCWDWWGYTGADYATKAGPQVMAIKATLDALAGRTL